MTERSSARPRVSTALPGPRSAAVLARGEDRESATRTRQLPFVIAEATGSHLRDLDGNVFIDFLAGAGVLPAVPDRPGPVAVGTGGHVARVDVLGNVQARGEQIAGRLSGLANHPGVREVRGTGLMWGIELVDPGDGRTVAELAAEVVARALRNGLIVEQGGHDDRVVRMLPALTVTAEVVDIALSILLHAIEGAWVATAQAA